MGNSLAQDLEAELWQLPKIDVHCHMRPGQLTTAEPQELIFYHFLWREYLGAGAKKEDFKGNLADDLKVLSPLWERVRHTSAVWCLRQMAKDLYGLDGELAEIVPLLAERTKAQPLAWEEVRAKLNLEAAYACAPFWEAEKLTAKEGFVKPLLERLQFSSIYLPYLKRLFCGSTLKESREQLVQFVREHANRGVRHFAGFIGNDFTYTLASQLELEALYRKQLLTPEEANVLVTYYLNAFLEAVGEAGGVAQFYLGAKWNRPGMEKGESYSIVNHDLVPSLVNLFRRQPDAKISVMNATAALGQELTIMARMLPNVSLAGFWWHAFNPPYVRQQIEERLSLLPLNKWVLLTTDSYNLQWCYGKIALALRCLAQVLAAKITDGELTRKEALQIGEWVLYKAPAEIYEQV